MSAAGAVGIGNMPAEFRSDASVSAYDEALFDQVLLVLGSLSRAGIEGRASVVAQRLHITTERAERILTEMRALGLVKYEVPKPGRPDGIVWRRSLSGIDRAYDVKRRKRERGRVREGAWAESFDLD